MPKEENGGQGHRKKNFEEITAEIFPNLMKTINPQIQESQHNKTQDI